MTGLLDCTVNSSRGNHPSNIVGKLLAALLVKGCGREAIGVSPSANGHHDLGLRREKGADLTHVRVATRERPLGPAWLIEDGRAHEGEDDVCDMAEVVEARRHGMLAGREER